MARYVRLVMVWLAFGLAFGAAVFIFLGGVLLPARGDDTGDHLVSLLTYGGLSWILFALVLALVSLRYQKTRAHQQGIGWFTQAVNTILLVVILASIARLFADIVPGFEVLGIVTWLDNIFGPAWAAVEDMARHIGMPTNVQSVMTAPVFMVVALVLARNGVTWGLNEVRPDRGQAGPAPRQRRQRRDRDATRDRKAKAATRKVAVASYAEAKALLAGTQMDLTFLALDIVGSTSMKQGEDPYVVEQSFADYRKLVERMLRRHGAYKQTWTPDGQMAAFRSPQSAVDCGRDILLALPEFNENVSKMRRPFTLRVGANNGVVSADDEVPMEEMSDFTIDVAGHMQKHAEPDSIWISEGVYEELEDRAGFKPNGQVVDERPVYAWRRPS